jgi:DNA-binding NtrC family response regulator
MVLDCRPLGTLLRVLWHMADKPLRILVIDDEALLRWSLSEILGRHGYVVVEAASASTARKVIDNTAEAIDVVMLDYRLPDSSDLTLLEEVRRRTPRSAVILMSAYLAPDVIQDALDRGAYCVVHKPFDVLTLEPMVRNAFQATRLH